MRYIVVVFDGKKEHIHKSIVADSEAKALAKVKNGYVKRTGKLSKLWNAEAYQMS